MAEEKHPSRAQRLVDKALGLAQPARAGDVGEYVKGLIKSISSRISAPTGPGVYALYEDGELIYIGQTETLRERLGDHHSGQDGPCTQQATHFCTETVDIPRDPLTNRIQKDKLTERLEDKERVLLARYKRAHNGKLPRCNNQMP